MKEVLKSLADFVFRFKTFIFLMVVGYTLIAVFQVLEAVKTGELASLDRADRGDHADAERVEQTQRLTEACYSQGMVLVDTDAGQRCADPRILVKVK